MVVIAGIYVPGNIIQLAITLYMIDIISKKFCLLHEQKLIHVFMLTPFCKLVLMKNRDNISTSAVWVSSWNVIVLLIIQNTFSIHVVFNCNS